jgi:hypothetical protein
MEQPRRSAERFEWTLAAQQGRYAEAVRGIAELIREEFSEFSSPPEQGLREKVAALDAAVATLADLGDKIERLHMVAEASRRYVETADPNERERARLALLFALEEVDRHVPEVAPN